MADSHDESDAGNLIPEPAQGPLTEGDIYPKLTFGKAEVATGLTGFSFGFATGLLLAYGICTGV